MWAVVWFILLTCVNKAEEDQSRPLPLGLDRSGHSWNTATLVPLMASCVKEGRGSCLCAFRFAWVISVVSRWSHRARVTHLELISLYITCMFFELQIPGATLKNVAGRMSNVCQSVAYSRRKMKEQYITNTLLPFCCSLFLLYLWSVRDFLKGTHQPQTIIIFLW